MILRNKKIEKRKYEEKYQEKNILRWENIERRISCKKHILKGENIKRKRSWKKMTLRKKDI